MLTYLGANELGESEQLTDRCFLFAVKRRHLSLAKSGAKFFAEIASF